MKIVTPILSLLYGLGVRVRNLLFDTHVLHSFAAPVPTVVVGNLAVGGTGKTPHVAYLVELYLAAGCKVAVLSRGYGRKTRGFRLVATDSLVSQVGDELLLLKRRFPMVPMAASAKRVVGVKRLLKVYPDLDVIVLDDAFQHRYLTPTGSLLLTPYNRLYTEDHLLPWGRLREPQSASRRAQAVVVTRCPETLSPIDHRLIQKKLHLFPFQQLFFSGIRYGKPQTIFPAENENDEQSPNEVRPLPESLLLLTGIADPSELRLYLERRGHKVTTSVFGDHHVFTARDMRRVESQLSSLPAGAMIVTTEKDAVRLQDMAAFPESLKSRICYLPINVQMEDAASFNQYLLHYVRKND